LSQLVTRLREKNLDISFSGLNDHVLDVMKRTHLIEKIGPEHFYYSVDHAVQEIHEGVCLGTGGHDCPLLRAIPKGLAVAPQFQRALEERGWDREEEKKE
jgi:hypothetical protein